MTDVASVYKETAVSVELRSLRGRRICVHAGSYLSATPYSANRAVATSSKASVYKAFLDWLAELQASGVSLQLVLDCVSPFSSKWTMGSVGRQVSGSFDLDLFLELLCGGSSRGRLEYLSSVGDARAQASYLVRKGVVSACLTCDSALLLLECPSVLLAPMGQHIAWEYQHNRMLQHQLNGVSVESVPYLSFPILHALSSLLNRSNSTLLEQTTLPKLLYAATSARNQAQLVLFVAKKTDILTVKRMAELVCVVDDFQTLPHLKAPALLLRAVHRLQLQYKYQYVISVTKGACASARLHALPDELILMKQCVEAGYTVTSGQNIENTVLAAILGPEPVVKVDALVLYEPQVTLQCTAWAWDAQAEEREKKNANNKMASNNNNNNNNHTQVVNNCILETATTTEKSYFSTKRDSGVFDEILLDSDDDVEDRVVEQDSHVVRRASSPDLIKRKNMFDEDQTADNSNSGKEHNPIIKRKREDNLSLKTPPRRPAIHLAQSTVFASGSGLRSVSGKPKASPAVSIGVSPLRASLQTKDSVAGQISRATAFMTSLSRSAKQSNVREPMHTELYRSLASRSVKPASSEHDFECSLAPQHSREHAYTAPSSIHTTNTYVSRDPVFSVHPSIRHQPSTAKENMTPPRQQRELFPWEHGQYSR